VRRQCGFTLIEMVIAVALSAMLVSGVYAALVSTSNVADRQGMDAKGEEQRMRAIELMRRDLRGRVKLVVDGTLLERVAEGTSSFTCQTTADSLGAGDVLGRGGIEVRYRASPQGLTRQESPKSGKKELVLLEESVRIEYWSGNLWKASAVGEISAVRLVFAGPPETVVIR
jgi:prepilin-type N-terminal cleavage/methylation domain-containing protein